MGERGRRRGGRRHNSMASPAAASARRGGEEAAPVIAAWGLRGAVPRPTDMEGGQRTGPLPRVTWGVRGWGRRRCATRGPQQWGWREAASSSGAWSPATEAALLELYHHHHLSALQQIRRWIMPGAGEGPQRRPTTAPWWWEGDDVDGRDEDAANEHELALLLSMGGRPHR
jgi:hypothetical protein